MRILSVNELIVAKETPSGRILLFTPSQEDQEGRYIPSSEIYITKEESEGITEFFRDDWRTREVELISEMENMLKQIAQYLDGKILSYDLDIDGIRETRVKALSYLQEKKR